jgi:hypothetical protein
LYHFSLQLEVLGCLYFWPTGNKLGFYDPFLRFDNLMNSSQTSRKHFNYVFWFITKDTTQKCRGQGIVGMGDNAEVL